MVDDITFTSVASANKHLFFGRKLAVWLTAGGLQKMRKEKKRKKEKVIITRSRF